MYTLPTLSYGYDELEPYISEATMRLHHQKHHQTYVTKLNEAMEKVPETLHNLSVEDLLLRLSDVPKSVRTAIRNNGGGHYNHTLFWESMTPGGEALNGDLKTAIVERYGSLDTYKDEFSTQAKSIFGSGWVWLMSDLSIVTTPNQDIPQCKEEKRRPILGLDVWEHAYYLDYQNVRPDYISAWWNVVNWNVVAQRYHSVNGQ